MANSTTNLDILTTNAQQEPGANALFNAASPSMLYARRESTTTLLTWGYYGGYTTINGTYTSVSNGTLALTASSTNYIEVNPAGTVSKNTTAFTAGSIRLYSVVTGTATITSYIDYRLPCRLPSTSASQAAVTIGSVNNEISSLTFSTPAAFNSTDGEIAALTFSAPAAFNSLDTEIGTLTFSAPAAFNSTDGEIAALTFSATPTQAEAQALRDKCEELGDDARALQVTVGNHKTEVEALRDKCEELGDDARALQVTVGNHKTEVEALRDKCEELGDDSRALKVTVGNHKTEVEALRDKCETLGDDVRALSVLLHQIRTDLITAGIIKGSA